MSYVNDIGNRKKTTKNHLKKVIVQYNYLH